jgi:hypothetical protein
MSIRGLEFMRAWTIKNVDLRMVYLGEEQRAHVLAAACRLDADGAEIELSEIESEIGNLEGALRGMIDGRGKLF